MANIFARLGSFFKKKPTLSQESNDKELVEALKKTGGAWAGLWQKVQESKLFGNKVLQPYAQIPTIYKAVKAISDNVPQAELIFKDWSSEEEVYPKDLMQLFSNPNPLMDGVTFLQYVVGFYALYGEAFIIKSPSIGQVANTGRKLPAELWTFCPTKFQEIRNKQTGEMLGWRYGQQEFPLDQVIHLKDFNPYSDIRGLDPTKPITQIIDIDWMSLVYNKAFFENNATIGFMLSTEQELTREQRTRLREWLDKTHAGASNAFKTAILEAGLKPEQIASSHKDMDFLEQKRFAREEILGIWRVPKALFNITEDLNYATFIGQMKIFWLYTINPILKKLADGLNRGLVTQANPSLFCEFDTSNVPAFQEDFKEKVTVAKDLFLMGFTGNEINEKLQLGFEDKEWRDHWWMPMSQVTAETAAEMAAMPIDPTPAAEDDPKPPKEDEEDEKAVKAKTAEDLQAELVWKNFLTKEIAVETRLRSAVKTHFFNLRKTALKEAYKASTVQNVSRLMDWEKQNQLLLKKTSPYIYQGIKNGEDFAKELLGNAGTLNEEVLKQKIEAFFAQQKRAITRINATIDKGLMDEYTKSLAAQEGVDEFANRIRSVFNKAENRTMTISRTTASSCMNGVTQIVYEDAGVTHKKWVTAGDEAVRDSHKAMNGEVVRANQKFSNGVDFPAGEGDPEEVINCRCTAYPIFRKG